MKDALEWRQQEAVPKLPNVRPKTKREADALRKKALDRLGQGTIKREGEAPKLPRNRAEALRWGWEETELGWDCNACVAKRREQEALDAVEDANNEDLNTFMIRNGLAEPTE